MRRKSLQATRLSPGTVASETLVLQKRYAKLIEDIPEGTTSKFRIHDGSSDTEKFRAVKGLLKKHSCEIVEADKRTSVWTLFQLAA